MTEFWQERLRETSTWRGIIQIVTGVLGGLGYHFELSPEVISLIIGLGISLSGGVALTTPDQRSPVLRRRSEDTGQDS